MFTYCLFPFGILERYRIWISCSSICIQRNRNKKKKGRNWVLNYSLLSGIFRDDCRAKEEGGKWCWRHIWLGKWQWFKLNINCAARSRYFWLQINQKLSWEIFGLAAKIGYDMSPCFLLVYNLWRSLVFKWWEWTC